MSEDSYWGASSMPDDDPEREQRQAAAQKAIFQTALALVAEGRGRRSFVGDKTELPPLVGRIRSRIPHIELSCAGVDDVWRGGPDLPEKPRVRVAIDPRGGVQLASQIDAAAWSSATIYTDGQLADEGSTSTISFGEPANNPGLEPLAIEGEEAETFPEPTEEESELGDYIRALAAPLQAGDAIQILSLELFTKGLLVRYRAAQGLAGDFPMAPPPPDESVADRDEVLRSEGLMPKPMTSIEDDVGTNYTCLSWGAHGVPMTRGEERFTPAVPDGATHLSVKSDSGAVELRLR